MIDVAFAACPLALISCVQAPLPKMQVNFFVEDVSFRLPEDCSWPILPIRADEASVRNQPEAASHLSPHLRDLKKETLSLLRVDIKQIGALPIF